MNKKLLLICCLIFFLSSASFGQTELPFDDDDSKHSLSLNRLYQPEPVAPFRDTLFYIYTSIGSFTPSDRAYTISERIQSINKEFKKFQADSLSVFTDDDLVCIAYHDFIIMTISKSDASLSGKTQLALAREYETIIKNAITKRQKDTYWLNILWRAFLVTFIVGVQYFLIRIVNHIFRKISLQIEQLKGKIIKTIRIKSYKLLDENRSTKVILFFVKILRILIIFVMLYMSVPMALSVFPATRNIANLLFGYVWTPFKAMLTGIVNFIPDLIAILIIIIIFRYIIKGLRFIADEIHKGRLKINGFYSDWAHPTFNIVRALLYAFMFILIFPHLPGSESRVFQGVSVFIGIIFSLGSTSVINNLMSGLVLTYMRPFKVGDRIKIGEIVGNVVEKTPFVTRLRTPKNEEVTIPNSGIMAAQTFNYSQSARTYKLILHTELTFGYDTPWRQVHELLLKAAAQTPDVLENPNPFILQTALDDFYAEYQLNVYVIDADKMAQIYSDLRQNIQDVFGEAGLEITSPHYRVYHPTKSTD